MGLPYSKQINAAFSQVTPLVAAGFETLQTTKNISLLLAVIQVLTVLLLSLILTALFAVLICINPVLENERDVLVTPVVKGAVMMVIGLMGVGRGVAWGLAIVGVGVAVGAGWGVWYTARDPTLRVERQELRKEGFDEDVEAIEKTEKASGE